MHLFFRVLHSINCGVRSNLTNSQNFLNPKTTNCDFLYFVKFKVFDGISHPYCIIKIGSYGYLSGGGSGRNSI